MHGQVVPRAIHAISQRLRASFQIEPQFFVTNAGAGVAEESVAP
jgi:hypothetical protein